ncbi:MAG: UDP-N-acetylmuramoyl-L-alanyl-D-glutamate--2,6-diaminopimelate ligase [Gemmatimonadetes bacterium]|nr:UDP-N-acetylmuramoyl-L-alanyl-D-glutamate--2,6-diaminopimelate ligase [Gemmatimonadota bacterium]
MQLARIAAALEREGLLVARRGALPDSVASIAGDSRAVTPGALFVAVRGSQRDGHAFLSTAAAAGATAAIVEDAAATTLPVLLVRDGRRAAAVAAAAFHANPARALTLVGVTGTNGKTTTVGMLRHLLDEQGARSASIGTLGVLVGSEGTPLPGGSGLTTPGPIELQAVLRALVDAGVRTVAMEVSSHALDQRRVDGVEFAAAVFTNLTRDHLDYHGTMEAYAAAKARLVDCLAASGAAVVNADDDAWQALPPAGRRLTFGITHPADVRATGLRFAAGGSTFTIANAGDRADVTLPLIGDFNVANALAAAAAALALGASLPVIAARLATMPQVPGRLEVLHRAPTVLRDYAHTPDALARAIAAVRPFARRRLVVVFGAGGDRDRGKRPEMGRIAAEGADLAIVTSDNPRTEDPERILDDIEAGMRGRTHRRIEDRRAAIAAALAGAAPDDLILLAGKGHETYQVRGTVSHPFDEKLVVAELTAGGATPPVRN